MEKEPRNPDFNPSGVGLKNGNFIGLPFDERNANVVLIPVPWDVTVSFIEGTAYAPQAILDASAQIDLYDTDIKDAWKLGIYMQPIDNLILGKRNFLRAKAAEYIQFLERGGKLTDDSRMESLRNEIDLACVELNDWVYEKCLRFIKNQVIVGLVGGDHSVPLGFIKALGESYKSFGILQIDAHFDLRNSYEGFEYSHASIFYNVLKESSVSKLVPVAIRDYCEEEAQFVNENAGKIEAFYDQRLKENAFAGMNWEDQCALIINILPENVYISFDVDGLDPKLCPNTGTPVPGGVDFAEINFLIKKLVENGRKIIGFDLCEVGHQDWDANVGARILYKLCNWAGRSQGKI